MAIGIDFLNAPTLLPVLKGGLLRMEEEASPLPPYQSQGEAQRPHHRTRVTDETVKTTLASIRHPSQCLGTACGGRALL